MKKKNGEGFIIYFHSMSAQLDENQIKQEI